MILPFRQSLVDASRPGTIILNDESPESFNRLKNPTKEDFDRFIVWLFSHTLTELRASRGDMTATRAAWIRYFRRGLKADLLLDELMTHCLSCSQEHSIQRTKPETSWR